MCNGLDVVLDKFGTKVEIQKALKKQGYHAPASTISHWYQVGKAPRWWHKPLAKISKQREDAFA